LGLVWIEIDAIIGWERRRYSFRIFLAVKALELGSSKRSADTELSGDFVMLLIALGHCK
jgi:hypothetical protein